MTIVTVDSPGDHLHLDAIPVIDLRVLSQSELNSLSICSENAFDLHRCDDVVIPKIDRSVFNESAGSRKQTYSRLRLAPRKPEITAVGRGRYNPVAKPHTNPVDDPERNENKEIVSLLRELFGKDSSIQFKDKNLVLFDENYANNEFVQEESFLPMVAAVPAPAPAQAATLALAGLPGQDGIVKRKRGRPKKEVVNFEQHSPKPKVRKVEIDDYYENVPTEENVVMEIVNKNGVVVDLAALACSEDPFGPELRERSAGLTTEEELLAFLRELKGQWGSRRKKRKVVDASDFGDALPLGWKLLLSLKRKEGHLSLYCRRYISPTGQQFASCKEVSSFLLPFFGFQGEDHPNSFLSDESDYETGKLSSGSSAGLVLNDESTKDESIYYEASPVGSFSSGPERQHALLGTENLAEVEIRDLLECHICKMNFDEKDAYLQHLLSSHQRSSKRSRHSNTSVCDGVIIKDGKYECQFCHKIFDEKHRYNGHVGVHVRNYVRSLESPGGTTMHNNPKSLSVSKVLPGFSGVDASADSDKGSVPLTSVPSNEATAETNLKSSSASRMLPEPSMVEASDNIEKGFDPQIPIPSDERTLKDNVETSSVSRVLSGIDGTEASAAIDKGSVPLSSITSNETPSQNNVEPSSVSAVLPGFPGVEASAEIDKISVPPISFPSDEIKAGSPRELDVDSNLDVSTAKPNSEQNFPRSEQNTGTNIPQSFPANPSVENVDSFHDNTGSGLIPENFTSTSNFEHSVGSPSMEQDNGADITDESVGGKSGEKQDTDTEMTDANLSRVDQTDDPGSSSIPQSSASTSSCEVNVGSSCSDKDIGDSKIDETLGEESREKLNIGIQMTDGILGRVEKTENNPNIELRSFLESSTVLCNNVEDGTPKTFKEKNVLTSTNVGNLGKVDESSNVLVGDFRSFLGSPGTLRNSVENRTNVTFEGNDFFSSTTDGKLGKDERTKNDLDGDFRSFLGSAGTLRNNGENCANVTYEGNNFFTRSDVGINNPGLHQGQGSFSFSFAPSGSKKTRGVEPCKDEFLSISMRNPEIDKGNEYGFNEPERRFGANINSYTEGSVMDSIGSAGKETMLQRLFADTSSPSLQSSGCFPTLDLMSNKRFVADTSSQMLQSSGCFPTLDLMSNKRLVADTSSSLLQSSNCFPTLDLMSNKGQGETENFTLQKFDNMSGFDELGFDDLESSKFGFVTGKEPSSLTQEHMDMSYDSVLEDALNTSVPFEWETVLPKIDNNQQQSTICVWCRMPFNHDAINPEMQSDSVGFMCPTCKSRISGQLNVLDNDGLSVNFDQL